MWNQAIDAIVRVQCRWTAVTNRFGDLGECFRVCRFSAGLSICIEMVVALVDWSMTQLFVEWRSVQPFVEPVNRNCPALDGLTCTCL